jgi:hypothetical protein
MKTCTLLILRSMTGVALTLGLLAAAMPVAAQSPPPPMHGVAPDVTVRRLSDRRTLVSVTDGQVSIRKEVSGVSSETTITTATDQLRVTVRRDGLTVTSPAGVAAIRTGRVEEVAGLLAVLQRSQAGRKGLALLRSLPRVSNDFGAHALLLTRAVLELAHGPSQALVEHRDWVERETARLAASSAGSLRPRVVRIQSSGADRDPGECWDAYAAEAIRIADDFLECTDDLRWYDALGWAGCSLVYTIRSEAAMFWYVSCSGGFPFSG